MKIKLFFLTIAALLFSPPFLMAGGTVYDFNSPMKIPAPGKSSGYMAEVPLPLRAEAVAENAGPKAARSLYKGRIKEIKLAGEEDPKDLQGTITILREDGSERSFLVSKYTLILISVNGYMYVTELKHLKPGWRCEVGYDIPPDDDWNMDKVEDGAEAPLKYAENMSVYYEE